MKGTAVRSISRAFEILEYFHAERRPLTLKAVMDKFGYPLVSTADILKSLLHLGYLSFDLKSKTYLPAPRLFELSSWMSNDVLNPLDFIKDIQEFHEKSGLISLLATNNDLELLTISCFKNHVKSYGRERRCLFNSGTGLALVSAMDDDIIERMFRLAAARGLVDRVSLSLPVLMAQVAEIRSKGYHSSFNCVGEGLMIVAMPLPVVYCNRYLAFGCAAPVKEIQPRVDEVAGLMKELIASHFNAIPSLDAMTFSRIQAA